MFLSRVSQCAQRVGTRIRAYQLAVGATERDDDGAPAIADGAINDGDLRGYN